MVKIFVTGAINWDINLFVERFPKVGEEVPVGKITRVPGGKAANAAVASARILGPGETALIGCLGKDSIAEQQIEILRNEGVVVSGIKISNDAESGQAYIIIDKEGKNVINTHFGANLQLSPRDIENPEIRNLLLESSMVALIDPLLETISYCASLAKRRGKIVLWDTGVRSMLGMAKLKEVLRNIDYLLVNQVEAENLTGEKNSVEAWKCLSTVNEHLKLIVKLGEKGCALISQEEKIEVRGVNLIDLGLKAVNTVGCGDSFLGVFAASKALDFKDEEALLRANLAGALKAAKPETRGSPTKEELERYLKYAQTAQTIRL